MPKVGDKNFPYTQAGKAAAKKHAMETGQDVIPTYDAGGRVQRIQGYNEGGKVEEVKGPDDIPVRFQKELNKKMEMKEWKKGTESNKKTASSFRKKVKKLMKKIKPRGGGGSGSAGAGGSVGLGPRATKVKKEDF